MGAEAKAAGPGLPEEVDADDIFWQPTWDTLGPLEQVNVKAKNDRNKFGRKRERRDKFLGLDTTLHRPSIVFSKKALDTMAEENANARAASQQQPGQNRKARMQRERRHRKLALKLEAGDAERILPLPAPPSQNGGTTFEQNTETGLRRTGHKKGVKKRCGKRKAMQPGTT